MFPLSTDATFARRGRTACLPFLSPGVFSGPMFNCFSRTRFLRCAPQWLDSRSWVSGPLLVVRLRCLLFGPSVGKRPSHLSALPFQGEHTLKWYYGEQSYPVFPLPGIMKWMIFIWIIFVLLMSVSGFIPAVCDYHSPVWTNCYIRTIWVLLVVTFPSISLSNNIFQRIKTL